MKTTQTALNTKTEKPTSFDTKTEKPIKKISKTAKPKIPMPPSCTVPTKSTSQRICCIHVVTMSALQISLIWCLILPVTGGPRVILRSSTTMEILNLKDLVSVNFVRHLNHLFNNFLKSGDSEWMLANVAVSQIWTGILVLLRFNWTCAPYMRVLKLFLLKNNTVYFLWWTENTMCWNQLFEQSI